MIVLYNELGDVLQVDKGRQDKKKSEKTGIVTDKHRRYFNRYDISYCAYAESLFFSSWPGSTTLDAPSALVLVVICLTDLCVRSVEALSPLQGASLCSLTSSSCSCCPEGHRGDQSPE